MNRWGEKTQTLKTELKTCRASEEIIVLYIINVKQCCVLIILSENRLRKRDWKDDSSAGHWHLRCVEDADTTEYISFEFLLRIFFAAHHADWWNRVAWRNGSKGKIPQFTNRPWHHGFSKAYSVVHNDPWVVEQCRSSWRPILVTVVFAHRCSLLRRPGLVWSGCVLVHNTRQVMAGRKVERVAGAHRDLCQLTAWSGERGEEGEDRACDDPRSSLSRKWQLCTSHNSQHCCRDSRDHNLMTCRRRCMLLCWRIDPPALCHSR